MLGRVMVAGHTLRGYVGDPFFTNRHAPKRLVQVLIRQPQQKVSKASGIQDVGVEQRRQSVYRLLQAEFLILGSQLGLNRCQRNCTLRQLLPGLRASEHKALDDRSFLVGQMLYLLSREEIAQVLADFNQAHRDFDEREWNAAGRRMAERVCHFDVLLGSLPYHGGCE